MFNKDMIPDKTNHSQKWYLGHVFINIAITYAWMIYNIQPYFTHIHQIRFNVFLVQTI